MVIELGLNPAKADHNCYWTGGAKIVQLGGGVQRDWAQWQAAGYDQHGLFADPLLISEYRLGSASPCIDAGADLSAAFTTDRDGQPRSVGDAWDIGAYEWRASMALVERLMHVDPDVARHIAVHEFFAAITELINGKLTAAQIQNYYGMTAEDLADWDSIAAMIPAQNQTAARALYCEHLHAAFILAEHRVPTYSTPAEVRTRLGI